MKHEKCSDPVPDRPYLGVVPRIEGNCRAAARPCGTAAVGCMGASAPGPKTLEGREAISRSQTIHGFDVGRLSRSAAERGQRGARWCSCSALRPHELSSQSRDGAKCKHQAHQERSVLIIKSTKSNHPIDDELAVVLVMNWCITPTNTVGAKRQKTTRSK
jgi:hypothetical protein